MKSPDHQQLMHVLNKLATQEKWARMPKKKGTVLSKEITKSGNLRFIIKTKKGEEIIYVLKKNKNLFEMGSQLQKGNIISVALRRYLGKMYCTRLVKGSMKKDSGKSERQLGLSQYPPP